MIARAAAVGASPLRPLPHGLLSPSPNALSRRLHRPRRKVAAPFGPRRCDEPHGIPPQAAVHPHPRARARQAPAPGPARHLRRPAAPRQPPPLRLPPADRRCAQELGRAQGPQLRPDREAHGGRGGGPPGRLRRLRGRNPQGPLRRRPRRAVRPRRVGDRRRPRGTARQGASALRAVRDQAQGRLAPGAFGQGRAPAAVAVVQGTATSTPARWKPTICSPTSPRHRRRMQSAPVAARPSASAAAKSPCRRGRSAATGRSWPPGFPTRARRRRRPSSSRRSWRDWAMPRRRAGNGCTRSSGTATASSPRSRRARRGCGRATRWNGPTRCPRSPAPSPALGLKSGALDGELIAGTGTREDFNLLQGTLSGERQGTLSYALFDLLHVDGIDISEAPLIERKTLLEQLLGDGTRHLIVQLARGGRWRGQRSNSPARSTSRASSPSARTAHTIPAAATTGARPRACTATSTPIVGFTAPKGNRSGFGSLLLATPDKRHGWRYVGRVGSGLLRRPHQGRDARASAAAGRRNPRCSCPENDTDLRSAKWFEPRFVAEVNFRGVGGQGLLRQPSLQGGSRRQVASTTCATADRGPRQGREDREDREGDESGEIHACAQHRRIRTHAAKTHQPRPRCSIPTIGYTKLDVANYYAGGARPPVAGNRRTSAVDHPLPRPAPTNPASSRNTTRRGWSWSNSPG